MSPGDRIENISTGRLATILEVGYDKVLIQFDGFGNVLTDKNTIYRKFRMYRKVRKSTQRPGIYKIT